MDRRQHQRLFILTLLAFGSPTSGCAHQRQVYYPNQPAANEPKVHIRARKAPALSVQEPPILKDAHEPD